MKDNILYVYNKLKELRFKTPNYRFPDGMKLGTNRDEDLYIDKNAFKPLEEELEYADRCHDLEQWLRCPLDVFLNIQLRRIPAVYTKDNEKYYIQSEGMTKDYFIGYCYDNSNCNPIKAKFPFSGYESFWWITDRSFENEYDELQAELKKRELTYKLQDLLIERD